MNRVRHLTLLWLALTLAASFFIGLAEVNGYFANDQVEVWSRAIITADTGHPFRAETTAYPVLPFVLMALVEPIWPQALPPVPSVLAAVIAALTLIFWMRTLRFGAGYSPAMAVGLVMLIAINPLFLRAISGGLDDALLMLGFWLMAEALIGLRLSLSPVHLFQLAIGHVLLLYSARFGMLIVAASLPMAIAATPIANLRKAAVSYALVLFFPVVFAFAGLNYADWIFQTTTMWNANVATDHAAEIWPIMAALPALAMILVYLPTRHVSFWPLLCALATIPAAFAIARYWHIPLTWDMAAAPLIGGLVALLHYWPPGSRRAVLAPALMLASLVSGGLSLGQAPTGETAIWLRALTGETVDGPFLANRRIAAFLQTRDDIMVDAESHPDIVVTLGRADTLILAGSETYDLAFLGNRLTARHVAVRSVPAGDGPQADAILQRFPELTVDTAHGYRLVMEDAGWRIFERVAPNPVTPTSGQPDRHTDQTVGGLTGPGQATANSSAAEPS